MAELAPRCPVFADRRHRPSGLASGSPGLALRGQPGTVARPRKPNCELGHPQNAGLDLPPDTAFSGFVNPDQKICGQAPNANTLIRQIPPDMARHWCHALTIMAR